jgi:hypothetical protein
MNGRTMTLDEATAIGDSEKQAEQAAEVRAAHKRAEHRMNRLKADVTQAQAEIAEAESAVIGFTLARDAINAVKPWRDGLTAALYRSGVNPSGQGGFTVPGSDVLPMMLSASVESAQARVIMLRAELQERERLYAEAGGEL